MRSLVLPVYVCVYKVSLPLESNIKTNTTEREKTVWPLSLALGSGENRLSKISFKITEPVLFAYAIKNS